MSGVIRELTADDWVLWKSIRLEALQLHPEAFSSSYEQEEALSNETFKQGLTRNTVFGAFLEDKLIGTVGFYIYQGQKQKHKGCLFGLYLKKDHRGQNLSDRLVKTVIDHARPLVTQILCTVVSDNHAAIHLYERHGFKIYGTEPKALKIGTTTYDEHYMMLSLHE